MKKRHKEIEQAVEKIVMICGALSAVVLDEFVSHIAYHTGKAVPQNLFSNYIANDMLAHRTLHRIADGRYTLNPGDKYDWKGEDALWVFMEHMEGVNLSDVMKGPYPAQMTYFKNERIYHIIRCEKEGGMELGMAREIEKETENRRSGDAESTVIEERFFFIFSDPSYLNAAPKVTMSPSVNVLVQIANRREPPLIKFAAAR